MPEHNQGLQVEHVSVAYGKHQALDNVSLRVAPGEITVILGANGAGKSSLLGTIAGLVQRQSGTVQLNGRSISGFKPHQVVSAGLAMVPEGRGIFGDLTVEENLTLGAHAPHAREHEARQRDLVYQLFPKLIERRRQVARTMSGGEQQMVAIGRAMMSNPDILMLDEPSLGLSPLLASEVFKTLTAVRDTGLGILLVEQNARQSLGIADRGYLIETGRITAEDTAQNLLNDPAVHQAYLGGAASESKPTSVASTNRADEQSVTMSLDSMPPPRPSTPLQPAHRRSEELAGGDISEWIRTAETRQRETWQTGAIDRSAGNVPQSPGRQGALDEMLARFERSARSQSSSRRPTNHTQGHTHVSAKR